MLKVIYIIIYHTLMHPYQAYGLNISWWSIPRSWDPICPFCGWLERGGAERDLVTDLNKHNITLNKYGCNMRLESLV